MRTNSAPPARETRKSSTSEPSRARAWARTPAGPATKSSTRSSGTRRRAAPTRARFETSVGELGEPGAPVAADQPPGPGPGERLAQVGGDDPRRAIGVAGAGEQRGGAEQHRAVGVAGQVGAEERQLRVGHRVDARPDQVGALGTQPQVGAAEGDDPRLGRRPGRDREPVRPGAGAGRSSPGPGSCPGRGRGFRRRAIRPRSRGARCRRRARRSAAKRAGDGGEVDHPGRGRVQGREAGGVRLELARPRTGSGGAGRGPRWRARGARARPAAAAVRPRWRRSACRSARRGSRARRSSRRARCAPATQRRAFSEPGA